MVCACLCLWVEPHEDMAGVGGLLGALGSTAHCPTGQLGRVLAAQAVGALGAPLEKRVRAAPPTRQAAGQWGWKDANAAPSPCLGPAR